MQFPKDDETLFKMYLEAALPEPEELVRIGERTQGRCEYSIHMIKGLPSLRRFNHRKIFFPVLLAYHDHLKCWNLPTHDPDGREYKVVGLNVLGDDSKWGRFGVCNSPLGSLMIDYNVAENSYITSHIRDYDVAENSYITSHIRDYIRRVEEGVYLGQFWYRAYGQYHHLGWFSMTKMLGAVRESWLNQMKAKSCLRRTARSGYERNN